MLIGLIVASVDICCGDGERCEREGFLVRMKSSPGFIAGTAEGDWLFTGKTGVASLCGGFNITYKVILEGCDDAFVVEESFERIGEEAKS